MYIKEYFIFLVALTPEIYSIHGGPFVLSLEGRREHTFLWLFCSAGLFFRLLSFLRKAEIIHVAWTVPPTPPRQLCLMVALHHRANVCWGLPQLSSRRPLNLTRFHFTRQFFCFFYFSKEAVSLLLQG